MSWADPQWLWLLLLLIPIMGYHFWKVYWEKTPSLLFSDTSELQKMPTSWKSYGVWLAPILQWAAFALLVLAMARPQYKNSTIEQNAEGIDIVMTLDISSSMKAEDLKPNRLEASKDVATDFINKRVSDRIGLVLFAKKSFTMVPPTLDYNLLKKLMKDVEMGTVEDGTAIGMGLATAVNRLKKSEAKSKVIILLTDGQNNAGKIDPVTAADLALSYDIKVYTIGAGTRGTAPYPVKSPVFGKRYRNIKVNIDEKMLKEIANMTGGKYFRATDTESLKSIYKQIDKLEKSKIDEVIYTDFEDLYPRFVLSGIFLLLLAFVCDQFLFRRATE